MIQHLCSPSPMTHLSSLPFYFSKRPADKDGKRLRMYHVNRDALFSVSNPQGAGDWERELGHLCHL